MKIILKSLIMIALLIPTMLSANDHCSPSWIAEIMLKIENQESKPKDEELFTKNLIYEIERQNTVYNAIDDVYGIKSLYLDRQDEKYKLALEIVIKSFENDNKNEQFNTKVYKEIIDKMTSQSENLAFDFYVNYKKNDINAQKKKFIPGLLLFKSTFLDWLIYSCQLWEQRGLIQISPWMEVTDPLNNYEKKSAFVENEIIKQREAAIQVSHKYSNFIENYKIHKKLESVIYYLKNLQKRFKDFASLIGIMPAKFVNFWFEK